MAPPRFEPVWGVVVAYKTPGPFCSRLSDRWLSGSQRHPRSRAGFTQGVTRRIYQGCPIGIHTNPQISGSSRKSSLDAAEEVHLAGARNTASQVGGRGGG